MTGGEEDAEEAAFVAHVRQALTARLARRPRGAAFSIMGAGRDDLETGRDFLSVLADGGYATPSWPLDQGGMGATPDEAAIVAQELTSFDVPDLYPFMVGIGLVGPVVMRYGTPDQQARWLPKIRTGEEIWCQLFSEPDAGSDLAGLTTRAEDDGGLWRVTGSKVWSSRAHYADWGLLLARTDSSVPKHAGITAFALDMNAPGVVVRPLRQMNGDSHFNQVFMDEAPILDTDRIAACGEGWRVAVSTLMYERGSIGGRLGVNRTQVVELAKEHDVAHDPVARDRAARAIAALEITRLTSQRARAGGRTGRTPGPEGSGAKLRMAQVLKVIADLAIDLQGPAGTAGYTSDSTDPWQTLFLTAPSLSIRGGTDEIQRSILGDRVLGLPPEPRVDKDGPFSDRAR